MIDPPGWWGQQCPGRSPGLTHAHMSGCPFHEEGVCCDCNESPSYARHSSPAIMPPIDVNARLRALGMMPASEDTGEAMEDIKGSLHNDHTPVEPKMVTGQGPQGRRDDRGRGDLTQRQMDRLDAWKGYILELGGDDRPDVAP